MANQGAKKRKEENSRHMRKLFLFIVACNVLYLLVRAGIFHSTFKWKQWVSFMLTFFAYIVPYLQLAMMAKPTYAEDGELLDGGFDMTTGGVYTSGISFGFFGAMADTDTKKDYKIPLESVLAFLVPWLTLILKKVPRSSLSQQCLVNSTYLHDVIYVTGFVQLGSIISEKFWYIYLVIPAFATYKLLDFVKGFFSHGSEEPEEEDEKMRKKRERMEKRASRAKFVRTRNR